MIGITLITVDFMRCLFIHVRHMNRFVYLQHIGAIPIDLINFQMSANNVSKRLVESLRAFNSLFFLPFFLLLLYNKTKPRGCLSFHSFSQTENSQVFSSVSNMFFPSKPTVYQLFVSILLPSLSVISIFKKFI